MSIKHRIKKLEDSQAVDKSGKLFIFVHLNDDEDANSGIKRYLEESDITKDQIGHAELRVTKLFDVLSPISNHIN